MTETIKTYQGASVSVSQCLVTLEIFIGDVDGKTIAIEAGEDEFIDDGTVDAADAIIAINGLIWSMEQCEARINELGATLSKAYQFISPLSDPMPVTSAEMACEIMAALESTATFSAVGETNA